MKLSLEIKGAVLGIVSAVVAVGVAFAAGKAFRPQPHAASATSPASATSTTSATSTEAGGSADAGEALVIPPEGTPAHQGYTLFLKNCAHCHGDDARGDEGPDLHGVTKSDARITAMIKNGVKGEMPKFAAKLNDDDIKALIAFVRTLKD